MLLRELEAAHRELSRISRLLTERRKAGRRVCSGCECLRDASEFYRSRGKPRSRCKVCEGASKRAWRAANREKVAAYDRAYGVAKWERIKNDPEELARKQAQDRARKERKKAGVA